MLSLGKLGIKGALVAGAVVGGVLVKVLESKKVRSVAVDTLAKAMIAKDKVFAEVNNIKEEVVDVYDTSKSIAQAEADKSDI